MHVQHFLAFSGLLFLGNAGLSLARLSESNVPSQCKDICKPVVDASQKCDRNVPDRETRMECKCTWIQLKTSGAVSDCHRCMNKEHRGNWHKRDDDYDSDSDDDSDDEDDDMYRSCHATATGSPATLTMTTSSMTSTMTVQPSASATGSESTESSSSSTASGSSSAETSTEDNGAASLPLSASLVTVAGLVTLGWL